MTEAGSLESEEIAPVVEAMGLSSEAGKDVLALVHSQNRVSVPRKDIILRWGPIVFDDNPLHRDESYASSVWGLEDVPAPATLLNAELEQYSYGLTKAINGRSARPFYLTGLDVSFKGWALAGRSVMWEFKRALRRESGVVLQVKGTSKKEEIVSSKVFLSTEMPKLSEPELWNVFLQNRDVVPKPYSVFEVTKSRVDDFKECLRGCAPRMSLRRNRYDFGDEIPYMFPAAFVPAGLLSLISTATGSSEGVYLSSNFRFYNPSRVGQVRNLIVMPREPREISGENPQQSGWMYGFKALQVQVAESRRDVAKPILSADVKVLSKTKIEV